MGLNDLAIEHTSNMQIVDSNTTWYCVPNPTGSKKRKWDLPSLINLNARSLSSEKMDELEVTVATHDVSIVCVSETWFKEYMDSNSLTMQGFCLERKDRGHGRAGGVACYIRNDLMYTRLSGMEAHDLEVIWIKIMPKKMPRKFSCILLACIYYTPKTEYLKIRDHIITCIDIMVRRHPECGVIVTGDFNQLHDNFMKTHYRFVQVVNVVTRGQAILDKIWTNMEEVYTSPVTISELGSSDHNMVLLKPKCNRLVDTGCVTRLTVRCMGPNEKAAFAMALSAIKWEPLFRLESCADQYLYYKTVICNLMEICFPTKVVTRHTADKPWVTDWFRALVRKRQRAHMSGDLNQAKLLRNKVNRAASKLKYNFYQTQIAALNELGSHDWWKNMKKIMGLKTNDNSCMQGLANKTTNGDCALLASRMNEFFVSVSEHLPRLNKDHTIFTVNEELPDQYVIDVMTTFKALQNVKVNKATGPDNIPAWVLRNHANVLAPPLTAIFNKSLREGVLPMEWKMANIIPLPKTNPPVSIEKDIRPISLTPIAAKVFESIIMKWVDDTIEGEIDAKQFGGISGTSTTDVLVEMIHTWYEATDKLDSYVRVVMLDFSKAFDLINHHLLLEKLQLYGLPSHIIRWMATFLLDRTQQVKIGNEYSHPGHPNGGVPQGTLSGPKCFLVYINDLETPVPLYKYIDDSTLFEVCDRKGVSVIQESVDVAAKWTEQNDMKINLGKSKEMIICFAQDRNFRNTIPNITIDGKDLDQVDHAKLLGVTISQDLTWNKHVENIVKKAGKRLYMLYQLKRVGISQNDLVTIYVSVVRPVLEYACPVWHTNLPQYLSDSIEMIQKRALKCIFPATSYAEILTYVKLETLKARRDCLCQKYFNKIKVSTHRLNYLLPDKRHTKYDIRQSNVYPLPITRTNRYRNSFIPWGLHNCQ